MPTLRTRNRFSSLPEPSKRHGLAAHGGSPPARAHDAARLSGSRALASCLPLVWDLLARRGLPVLLGLRPCIALVLACVCAPAPALEQPSPPPPAQAATQLPSAQTPPPSPLGSKENPVKSAMPIGEREYLMRLRCPGGDEPEFERIGSFGAGPDGHIIDGYDVKCAKDGRRDTVFMDMYHRGYREMAAVPGFTALPELPALVAQGCPPAVPGHAPGVYVFRPLEVRQGPRPLSDIEAPLHIGRQGRAYAEFVIDARGAVDPARLVILYVSDEALRQRAAEYFQGLKFKPAEHHAGCPVPLIVRLGVDFS